MVREERDERRKEVEKKIENEKLEIESWNDIYLFFRFDIYDEMKNIDISILDRVGKGKSTQVDYKVLKKKVITNLWE